MLIIGFYTMLTTTVPEGPLVESLN